MLDPTRPGGGLLKYLKRIRRQAPGPQGWRRPASFNLALTYWERSRPLHRRPCD